MRFKDFVSAAKQDADCPTVMTDEAFTVSFFNDFAKTFIPGLRIGVRLNEIICVYDLSGAKRSTHPLPCVAKIGDSKAFCSVTPVSGACGKGFAFVFSPPPGFCGVSSEQFLMMKLAAQIRSSPSGASYAKFHTAAKVCSDICGVLGEESSAVHVISAEAFCAILNYYCELRCRNGKKPDIGMFPPVGEMYFSSNTYLSALELFNTAVLLAGDNTINVYNRSTDDEMNITFSFKPKRSAAKKCFAEGVSAEDALYMALGYKAADFDHAKILALENRGQVSVMFAGSSKNAEISLYYCVDKNVSLHAKSFEELKRIVPLFVRYVRCLY